jgi:hypothetical protein
VVTRLSCDQHRGVRIRRVPTSRPGGRGPSIDDVGAFIASGSSTDAAIKLMR